MKKKMYRVSFVKSIHYSKLIYASNKQEAVDEAVSLPDYEFGVDATVYDTDNLIVETIKKRSKCSST